MTTEQRRRLAYHEAGHAAMHWFFMSLGNIQFISMEPNDDSDARVGSTGYMRHPAFVAKLPEPFQRSYAAMGMMHALAGLCMENRVSEQDPHWLDVALDEPWWWEGRPNDITVALELSRVIHGQGRRVWSFLRMIARWNDEVFDIPNMRAAVDVLAPRLVSESHLEGDVVSDLIESAAGETNRPPFLATRRWRRRLALPMPSSCDAP